MDLITTLCVIFITGLALVILFGNWYLLEPRSLVFDFKNYLLTKENYLLLPNKKEWRVPKNNRKIDTADGEYSNPICFDLIIQDHFELVHFNRHVLEYLGTRGRYFRCLSVAESFTILNPSIATMHIAFCDGGSCKDCYRITSYLLHERESLCFLDHHNSRTTVRICIAYKQGAT